MDTSFLAEAKEQIGFFHNQMAADKAKLDELEGVIARGLQTFVEVGSALDEISRDGHALTPEEAAELAAREARIEGRNRGNDEDLKAIRDGRLYRADYGTFEDYCRERWGYGRIYVHRLIAADEVKKSLLPIGNIQPTSEGQIRPLTTLKTPEAQREVWQEAVATAPEGKVTGKHVAAVVSRLYPKASAVVAVPFTCTATEEGDAIAGDEQTLTLPDVPGFLHAMFAAMQVSEAHTATAVWAQRSAGATKATLKLEQERFSRFSVWLQDYLNA